MNNPELVADLIVAQGGRCAGMCGRSLARCGFEIDHINPRVLGGMDNRKNYQLTCPICNREKGGMDPLRFYRKRGFLL